MIGYYNYTVILTYIGTLFGFIGITYTWGGNLKMAGAQLRDISLQEAEEKIRESIDNYKK